MILGQSAKSAFDSMKVLIEDNRITLENTIDILNLADVLSYLETREKIENNIIKSGGVI
jgi:hypothetical protein